MNSGRWRMVAIYALATALGASAFGIVSVLPLGLWHDQLGLFLALPAVWMLGLVALAFCGGMLLGLVQGMALARLFGIARIIDFALMTGFGVALTVLFAHCLLDASPAIACLSHIGGLVALGVCQWYSLGRSMSLDPFVWTTANAAGWGLGLTVGMNLDNILGLNILVCTFTVGGAIAGAFDALVLTAAMRQHSAVKARLATK